MKSFIKSVLNTKILFLCACTTSSMTEKILQNDLVKNGLLSLKHSWGIMSNSYLQVLGKEHVVPMKFHGIQMENGRCHLIYSNSFIPQLSRNVAFYLHNDTVHMSIVVPNKSKDSKELPAEISVFGNYFVKLNSDGTIHKDALYVKNNGQEEQVKDVTVSFNLNNNKEIVITQEIHEDKHKFHSIKDKIKKLESSNESDKQSAQTDLESAINSNEKLKYITLEDQNSVIFGLIGKYYYINVALTVLMVALIISFICYSIFNQIKTNKLPQRIKESVEKGIKVQGYSEIEIQEYVTRSENFNKLFEYLSINNNGLEIIFAVEEEKMSEKNLNSAVMEMIPAAQNEIKFLEVNGILNASNTKSLFNIIEKYMVVLEPSSSKLKIKEKYFVIGKTKQVTITERFTKSAKVIFVMLTGGFVTLVGFVAKHVASGTSDNEEFDEE